jgi:hypothetical protein
MLAENLDSFRELTDKGKEDIRDFCVMASKVFLYQFHDESNLRGRGFLAA